MFCLILLAGAAACAPAAPAGGAPGEAIVTPAAILVPANVPGQPDIVARDLAAALARTRAAGAYRIGFDFETGTGDGGTAGTQPYVAFDGEIHGDANHITYNGGAFTEMLGNVSRVEVITVGENTYLKGSRLFGIADGEHWYRMPDSGLSKPPFTVEDLLRMAGDDISQARSTGSASIDGQACQAWSLDVKSEAAPVADKAAAAGSNDGVSIIDSAEATFITCADGFVHRMQWNVRSHNSANAGDKGTIAITVHLYDFNAANIVIAAPPEPLEIK